MSSYLDWQANLSLETIFQQSEAIAYPHQWRDGVVYLTSLIEEHGRSALVYRTNNHVRCLTPQPFSLRTRINEYGGKPFWFIDQDQLVFTNDEDQCLYLQNLADENAVPTRISPLPTAKHRFHYADVCVVDGYIVAVVEKAFTDHAQENECFIGIIDPQQADAEPIIFEQGSDFYAKLSYCATRKTLAWMQWSHPMMSWDENQLCVRTLEIEKYLQKSQATESATIINLGKGASVSEVLFTKAGKLFVVADFVDSAQQYQDFWNIYAIDFDQKAQQFEIQSVTTELAEFGYPHWQYGDQRLIELDSEQVLAIACYQDQDQLWLIQQQDYSTEKLKSEAQYFQNLSATEAGNAMLVMRSKSKSPSIAVIAAESKSIDVVYQLETPVDEQDISRAEHFSYQTENNETAYGYYYPAKNQNYQNDTPPPLLVMVHGGPTARAYGFFDLQKQFWTQSGFAIFDVNHRGSIGYGREYRDRLYSQWGVADTEDVIAGVTALIESGKADPSAICIRGKSAGGYAVLRALTEVPELFCAGANYYGIGNLATLASSTHKFEKHYTDRLLDEEYDETEAQKLDSHYYTRSPVNYLSQLKSSMIVFQGLKDNIVPPSVAQELVAELEKQRLSFEYIEYQDEGHGFRQANNNIDAWQRELSFYRKAIKSKQNESK